VGLSAVHKRRRSRIHSGVFSKLRSEEVFVQIF
jgi:hypothetical protein